MIKKAAITFCLCFLYIAFAKADEAKDAKTIFNNVSPSVVYILNDMVEGGQAQGSGFIVKSDGTIVTNYHVVKGAKSLSIRLKDETSYPADSIVYLDKEKDIVILKIKASNLPTLSLGNSDSIVPGEKVFSIGNPLGFDYSLSDGIVSAKREMFNHKWIQFTAPVSHGNSGGPLVDASGNVIGVVTLVAAEGQNVNFALEVNEIKGFIDQQAIMPFSEFVNTVSAADKYLYDAYIKFSRGDIEMAVDLIKKSLEVDPNNDVPYATLGNIYLSNNKLQEAEKYFSKAISIKSTAAYHNNLGLVYDRLGNTREAINQYEMSLKLDPYNSSALSNAGSAYGSLGEITKAKECLLKSIELNPANANAYNNLAVLFREQGQNDQAINNYKKAIEINPFYFEAYDNLAAAYGLAGLYEEAIDSLNKAILIQPKNPTLYFHLGLVYKSADQIKNAKINFKKALDFAVQQGDSALASEVSANLKAIPWYKF